jgi:hypothetical protein
MLGMAFSTRRRHGGAQEDQAINVAGESSKKNRAENRKIFLALVFLCVTLVSIFGLRFRVLVPALPWESEVAEAVLLSERRPVTASVRGNLAPPDAITSEKV